MKKSAVFLCRKLVPYCCSRVFEILEIEPHPVLADPVFEGPTKVKKTLMGTETFDDFFFNCKVQWTNPDALRKGEQFEVVFTFNGLEVPSVPPKKTDGDNLNVKLWSKEIKGHVGKTVSKSGSP